MVCFRLLRQALELIMQSSSSRERKYLPWLQIFTFSKVNCDIFQCAERRNAIYQGDRVVRSRRDQKYGCVHWRNKLGVGQWVI